MRMWMFSHIKPLLAAHYYTLMLLLIFFMWQRAGLRSDGFRRQQSIVFLHSFHHICPMTRFLGQGYKSVCCQTFYSILFPRNWWRQILSKSFTQVICSLTKLVPLHFHIWCTFPSMYDHIISGRCHQIPANEKISYFLIFECFNPIENSEVLGFFWALSKFFVILNQDHVICYNQYHIELMLSIQSQEEPWAIITIVFIFRHASVSRTYPGTYNRKDPHITARIHNITARIHNITARILI